jgi:cytochrome o ubiquinol oxidase subunit III
MTKETLIEERSADSTAVFGFFTYLMTDFVLFASLFAVYAVLHVNTFGGPSAESLFSAPLALLETLILLSSSFTCGLSLFAAKKESTGGVILGLLATLALGALFVVLEVSEFAQLVASGNGPSRSAFLSSFFTLVGTHGLHVTIGLLWIVALIIAIARRGLTRSNLRKLTLFALFWHFLEIIWIFIFTIVYLMGIL